MTVQASNIQRDTSDRRAAIARMSLKDLSCAWWANVHCGCGDNAIKSAIGIRARELGLTQRDLAREAHRGGLIDDQVLAGYR